MEDVSLIIVLQLILPGFLLIGAGEAVRKSAMVSVN